MLVYLSIFSVFLSIRLTGVSAHGRLWEPVGRATAFRKGFPVPPNYDDNGMNCGGYYNQWYVNDGKCGICGDPWQGPREHEVGGKYATGVIVQSYTKGQKIDVRIELTKNHGGWFEFRICNMMDSTRDATQQCLDEKVLRIKGHRKRYHLSNKENGFISLRVRLPRRMVCDHCVFQWIYEAAQHTGQEHQEHFYGCADIEIKNI